MYACKVDYGGVSDWCPSSGQQTTLFVCWMLSFLHSLDIFDLEMHRQSHLIPILLLVSDNRSNLALNKSKEKLLIMRLPVVFGLKRFWPIKHEHTHIHMNSRGENQIQKPSPKYTSTHSGAATCLLWNSLSLSLSLLLASVSMNHTVSLFCLVYSSVLFSVETRCRLGKSTIRTTAKPNRWSNYSVR